MFSVASLPKNSIYAKIQTAPLALSERDFAACVERSRFDPRLMEVMTEHVRDFWWHLDPALVNKACRKNRSPYVIKGIVAIIFKCCKMNRESRLAFSKWSEIATRGIEDAAPQLLYIGVFPIGSRSARREAESALPDFFQHGLIVSDLPFNKGQPGSLGMETSSTRVDELDLLKMKFARKIKRLKMIERMSNDEISKRTGINRVFLSRILNSRLESISVEYLHNHTKDLPT